MPPTPAVDDAKLHCRASLKQELCMKLGDDGFQAADDLAPTFGVGGDGDYRRDSDDASAQALLDVGGV